MSVTSLKILVCGDVNGHFDALLKRVNNVNKKSGPFDMLFCVGEFFGPDKESNERVMFGEVEMPISTYILGILRFVPAKLIKIMKAGPCSPSTSQFYPEDGKEYAANLTYLGKRGILNTTGGLQVAYLSGIEGAGDLPFQFSQNDVDDLLTYVKASTGFLGLDLLFTSMWPAQISKFSTNCPKIDVEGSSILSQLAAGLKPRYHFAGMGTHYERTPYRNHRLLQEAAQHVTRFIGLAPVNNPDKDKWLYAFSITPIRKLSRTELTLQPANATEFPYMEILAQMILKKRETAQQSTPDKQQYFFDMSVEVDDEDDRGGKRRRRNENSVQPKIQQPCWFCLSNVDAEQYLVISVSNESYLAMPKGPLVDDHTMILSIGHIQSIVAASQAVRDDIKKYKDTLTLIYNRCNKVPVFFERNYKTQHLQLQVVPVPKSRAKSLRISFLNAARVKNIEMVSLKEDEEIWDVVNEGIPYFIVELPDGTRLYSSKMSGFPLQFGREVLAGPALLDCEEKIDWHQCQLDKDEQTKLVDQLKLAFEPYDFTAEDE
ncbi:unnamed protein product [Thelazia callipaeda]|uniref:CwfJ_C_1 domain-containing protein n=1 Tax=Thelazia callipaeda TaxID=103827 RepID=A0A0N5D6J8_THECL|nr:unnamed protein product [Thelazia callipaeda]